MRIKLLVLVVLAMFLSACGEYEIVKKDKTGDTKTETTTSEDGKKDDTKIEVSGNDGEKVEIKDGGIKVKDGDKEINISEDGISIKSNNEDDGKEPKDGDKADSGDSKIAEKLILKGMNENKTIACEGRRILANGTGNRYKFTGECSALLVSGVGQTITVEKVGRINVNGTGNKITYAEGLDGKEPKVSNAGTGNSISKN